ncbi:MAG TPA: VCBS repeat-containing protein [Acidimicrobiales bacterium]
MSRRYCAAFAATGAAILTVAGCDLGAPRTSIDTPAAKVATGDMDGDGLTDIVSVGDDTVAVHLADGADGFATTTDVADDELGEFDWVQGALVDADLDGDLDVVAARRYWRGGTDTFHLYANDGTGGLTPGAVFGGFELVDDLAVGDTDGDGVDDLVAVSETTTVVYPGDGAGGFHPRVSHAGGGGAVELADVDGDGVDDVLVGGGGGPVPPNEVAVHLSSVPDWDAAASYPAGPSLTWVTAVRAGDLDGDGVLDLVVGGPTTTIRTAHVSVLRGVGDGTFGPPVVATEWPRTGAVDLEVADIDDDGHADAAVAEDEYGGAQVLFGDGALGFGDAIGLGVTDPGLPGPLTTDVAVGDVVGDTAIDVVAAGTIVDVFPNALADG